MDKKETRIGATVAGIPMSEFDSDGRRHADSRRIDHDGWPESSYSLSDRTTPLDRLIR